MVRNWLFSKAEDILLIVGMPVSNFIGDGHLDLLLIGNFHGNVMITGPFDASNGNYLLGNGTGDFRPVPTLVSGFKVDGNARSLVRLQGQDGQPLPLASQYADSLKVFQMPVKENYVINLKALDAWAHITYKDGRSFKKEFYYGDSYLSQSSRTLLLDDNMESVVITDFQGNQREVFGK